MRSPQILAVALTVLILDQLTKRLVFTQMQLGQNIPLLGKALGLTYIHNYGGAFGVFQNKHWLFLLTGWGVTAGLLFSLPKIAKLHWLNALSYALILGGAVGNLIDRSFHNYVVDFVEVGLPGPWGPGLSWVKSFPCFNVADSGITVGITVLLVWSLLHPEKPEKPEKPELPAEEEPAEAAAEPAEARLEEQTTQPVV